MRCLSGLLMTSDSTVQFDKVAAIAEIRSGLVRYLSAGAKIVSDATRIRELTGLSDGELERLCATHLLTSEEALASVRTLPDLVRRLPSTAVLDRVETRGVVQGQIRWRETVQLRLQSRDPSLFVCARPERRYDTPRGHLLKATVENLHETLRMANWVTDRAHSDPTNAHASVAQRSASIARTVELLLDSRKLREVPRVKLTSAVLASLRSREDLVSLCDLYESFQRLIVAREATALIDAVSTRLFAPDVDRMFELIVAFRLVRAFQERGWELRPASGLLGARTPVGELTRDGDTLRLFWQTSVWDTESARATGHRSGALLEVAEASGSRIRRYRPDLLVEYLPAVGRRRICIGEVKLTSLTGSRAEANGVLECFGYLRDAQNLDAAGVDLRGFVVAWNATGRPANEVVAIASQNEIGALASVLAAGQ